MLLRAEAPAKINRELRVGARRPDGFHEIRSRFSTIDLADRLEIEDAEGLEIACAGLPIPEGDSNLVARAARSLAEELGIASRARIRLEKRIPVGAGLGGGSADAAVTLLLLSELWHSPLSAAGLSNVAGRLGSDVPFFLHGGEADVTGRGERVTPREDGPVRELLLLVPPFSIATGEVYAAYSRLTGGAARLPERLEVDATRNFLGPNDLASAVLETNFQMVGYLKSAREVATESGITGSGSALVLCGVTTEGERRLAGSHPEAALYRVATVSRADYRHRTSQGGGPEWKSPR
jgi:4-diphosphocytidyl-2-C-methyl-D-erythritol kinase